MSRRLTAEDVELKTLPTAPNGYQVEAHVTNQGRLFIVDRLSAASPYFCTCRISTAHAAMECAHIRATKEALNEHAS